MFHETKFSAGEVAGKKYAFMTDAVTLTTYCIAPIVNPETKAGGGYFAVRVEHWGAVLVNFS